MPHDPTPSPAPPLTGEAHERRLLARVAAGDRRAFDQLYFLYRPRLNRFLLRMLGSESGADALVNDVMYTVWTRAGSFAGRSRVSTWVFGIAYRLALAWLRKRKLRTRLFRQDPAMDEHEAADEYGLDERHDWLRRGLDALSPQQRAVVELSYFGGYDYNEIATIVDCPVGTVKTRMFSARRKLKTALPALATGTDTAARSGRGRA